MPSHHITGEYTDTKPQIFYQCRAYYSEFFCNPKKFNSSCSLSSVFDPSRSDIVPPRSDSSLEITRTEVLRANCQSNLGNVFAGLVTAAFGAPELLARAVVVVWWPGV
ncbi:peptide-methionine (R)-S-oxide reductase, partial [Mycobacterium lepromatosis]